MNGLTGCYSCYIMPNVCVSCAVWLVGVCRVCEQQKMWCMTASGAQCIRVEYASMYRAWVVSVYGACESAKDDCRAFRRRRCISVFGNKVWELPVCALSP